MSGRRRTVRFCDELEFALGWISADPPRLERASHALAAEGRVWVVDAVDGAGVEERVRALGDPAGVVQLLDRHERDCATLAARLGIPHHRPPLDGVPDAPFDVIPIMRRRWWSEAALWWADRAVLVCADALGTAPYYRGPGEALAVHPLLRLTPPRRLAAVAPEHILVGHGEGVHGPDAAAALQHAIATSRRAIPRFVTRLVKEER